MPVDQGLVDADTARDPVDAGVLTPGFVEQVAGGIDNLALALTVDGRAGFSGGGHTTDCNQSSNLRLQ